jgi:hypothetical protein
MGDANVFYMDPADDRVPWEQKYPPATLISVQVHVPLKKKPTWAKRVRTWAVATVAAIKERLQRGTSEYVGAVMCAVLSAMVLVTVGLALVYRRVFDYKAVPMQSLNETYIRKTMEEVGRRAWPIPPPCWDISTDPEMRPRWADLLRVNEEMLVRHNQSCMFPALYFQPWNLVSIRPAGGGGIVTYINVEVVPAKLSASAAIMVQSPIKTSKPRALTVRLPVTLRHADGEWIVEDKSVAYCLQMYYMPPPLPPPPPPPGAGGDATQKDIKKDDEF